MCVSLSRALNYNLKLFKYTSMEGFVLIVLLGLHRNAISDISHIDKSRFGFEFVAKGDCYWLQNLATI